MMVNRSDCIFVAFIVVALIAATVIAVGRVHIEGSSPAVEMIVDADDARQVAAAAGLSLPELLTRLRQAGATALAVREMTVEELAQAGRLRVASTAQGTFVEFPDVQSASMIAVAIQAKLPKAKLMMATQAPVVAAMDMQPEQLAKVPVLLRLEDIQAARTANLRLVARLGNFAAATPQAITAAAAEAAAAGARLIVFRDEEVLGYRALIKETAEAFGRQKLLYGLIEMTSQKGDEDLASRMTTELVRVHSITDAEMQTLTPQAAVLRYARAVRERSVRACYVRLLVQPNDDPMARNVEYLQAVARAVGAEGFRIGPPGPFKAPEDWPPVFPRALVLLALPAALVLLVRRLTPLGEGWSWLAFVVVALLGFALAETRGRLVVPISGLSAACIFPALATVAALQRARKAAGTSAVRFSAPSGSGAQRRADARSPIGPALAALTLACVTSLAGGLLIAGLYSRLGYLVGAEPFVGVKLSYLAPLPFILLAVIGDVPGGTEPWSVWWMRVRLRVGEFLRRPVVVVEATAILVALGAIAFVLMRSGNESAVAPSAVELKVRSLLESWLVARPRTKELLIGHPALMLAFALSLRGRKTWLPFAALLAAIGQISIVNTLCHFHIPLYISLLRILHGFWMGALAGVITILIWRALFDRRQPTAAQTPSLPSLPPAGPARSAG
jgi:hypothetical protein